MRKRILTVFILILVVASFSFVGKVGASNLGLVISQAQLGDGISANNEFVELYNNSIEDIDITNLCIYYASASNTEIGNKMGCFIPEINSNHLFLPSFSYSIAISNQLHISIPDFGSDLKFSSTLSGTSGHIRLVDENKLEIDKLAWGGNSLSAEGLLPVATPPAGKVLSRKLAEGMHLKDSNINADDFEIISPREAYSYGSVYEVQDVCLNLDGLQPTVPEGYVNDLNSSCNPFAIDVCSNIIGNQENIPKDYVDGGGGICLFDISDIKITELMPNPSGADEDGEYIELYNSEDKVVDLSKYILRIGADSKEYAFPAGSFIEPNEYMTFYNKEMGFALVNSSSVVRLFSLDGQAVDESISYTNPIEGSAWVVINGLWQYTNQPTPNGINLVSLNDPVKEYVPEQQCASGQYRSAETNRCRLIVSSTSNPVPCKDGQYRSEETNRCRNILSNINMLQPCDEGQERNPETNRCRSLQVVLGANSLAPCKEGQERNIETNRCRNITKAVPKVGFAPEKTVNESSKVVFWITISIFVLCAVTYGILEWRWEIGRLIKKVSLFVKLTK